MTFDTSMLITVLEGIMIEAFIPSMNDKGGELMGTLYRQVEDPALIAERLSELRRMVGEALSTQ